MKTCKTVIPGAIAFNIIISYVNVLIHGVENWQNKPWLKTAMVSSIQARTTFNKEYIEKVVDTIYLSFDL